MDAVLPAVDRAPFNWNIAAHLTWRARFRPDHVAITDGSTTYTYRELDARVSAAGAFFLDRGVGVGDRVGIVAENRLDVVTTVLALARIGAVAVPTNWRLAAPELEFIAGHAGLAGIVTQSKFAETCERVASATDVTFLVDLDDERDGGEWHSFSGLAERFDGADVADHVASADEMQRIMYTSGTTSLPKGVMISHGNVVWNGHCHMLEVGLGMADVVLLAAPLFHVGGLDAVALATLYAGGTVRFATSLDVGELVATVAAEGVTSLGFVPAQVIMAINAMAPPRDALSSLRLVISGGNTPEHVDTFRSRSPQIRFANGYGMTELSSGCSYSDYDIQDDPVRRLCAGRPFPFMSVRVLDDDDRDVPPGQVGELVWSGPKVCLGYWRDPEATAALFTSDGWLRTGDNGFVDEGGYVFFVDRKKDMLKSGGENVATAEVEVALLDHPDVVDVGVIGVPDDRWGEVPRAFVVRRPNGAVDGDQLRAHLVERLAKFKVPRDIVFVETLPRNESGKILKRELRTWDVVSE
jgi:fatty-acyl-CoA synthase